jgi:hypothetical protein
VITNVDSNRMVEPYGYRRLPQRALFFQVNCVVRLHRAKELPKEEFKRDAGVAPSRTIDRALQHDYFKLHKANFLGLQSLENAAPC